MNAPLLGAFFGGHLYQLFRSKYETACRKYCGNKNPLSVIYAINRKGA